MKSVSVTSMSSAEAHTPAASAASETSAARSPFRIVVAERLTAALNGMRFAACHFAAWQNAR
jgi:hypothetical protein